MIQFQIRISCTKGNTHFNHDILEREDANHKERKIAQHMERIVRQALVTSAEAVGGTYKLEHITQPTGDQQ